MLSFQRLQETHLKILSGTVPDVHGLEEGIITVIEGATIRVEFVGELLLLAASTIGAHVEILPPGPASCRCAMSSSWRIWEYRDR
jgi:hypothetical protein